MSEKKEYIVRFTQEVSVTVKVLATDKVSAEELVDTLFVEDDLFRDTVASEPWVFDVEAVEASHPSVSAVKPMLDYTKEV